MSPAITFGCAIGLIAGNFVFQATGPQAWDVALERSFYQVIACAALWALHSVFDWSKQ